MKPLLQCPLAAACTFISVAFAQPGQTIPQWIAWNADLEAVRGTLLAISAEGVRLQDDRGRTAELPSRELVALMLDESRLNQPLVPPMPRAGEPGRAAIVSLTDGQRWPCLLLGADDGDALRVRVPGVGLPVVALDFVRSITFPSALGATPTLSLTEDRLVLANDDVVEGTVLRIDDFVEVETQGKSIQVPLSSVAAMDLVNPRSNPAPMRLWLNGGAVFATDRLSGTSQETLVAALFAPSDSAGSSIGELRPFDVKNGWSLEGIEYAPARLIPWASLQVASFEPEPPRRWTPAPRVDAGPHRLGLAAVHLPGPMIVHWELPRAATRAGGTVTLDDPTSHWADCTVQVLQGGRLLWEQRLHREQPGADFSVPLSGSESLAIQVLAGEFGPVDDRVSLSLAWVLLAR